MPKPSSILDQIRELEKQRDALLDSAIQEAKAKANTAIAELNELGGNYYLGNTNERKSRSTANGTRGKITDSPCPICQFKTEPGHDGRKHRSQGENKRPFGPDDLKALGLKRAD